MCTDNVIFIIKCEEHAYLLHTTSVIHTHLLVKAVFLMHKRLKLELSIHTYFLESLKSTQITKSGTAGAHRLLKVVLLVHTDY